MGAPSRSGRRLAALDAQLSPFVPFVPAPFVPVLIAGATTSIAEFAPLIIKGATMHGHTAYKVEKPVTIDLGPQCLARICRPWGFLSLGFESSPSFFAAIRFVLEDFVPQEFLDRVGADAGAQAEAAEAAEAERHRLLCSMDYSNRDPSLTAKTSYIELELDNSDRRFPFIQCGQDLL